MFSSSLCLVNQTTNSKARKGAKALNLNLNRTINNRAKNMNRLTEILCAGVTYSLLGMIALAVIMLPIMWVSEFVRAIS